MKNNTFLKSVKCAFLGLVAGIKKERNFTIYFINVAITLILNIIFGFSYIQFLIWGLTIAGVFSAECINTAIEAICNYLTENKDEKIKFIKDIAAGAVLCWGILFYAAEIIMLLMKIF